MITNVIDSKKINSVEEAILKTTSTGIESLFLVLNPEKKYIANIVAVADDAKVYVSAEFIKG